MKQWWERNKVDLGHYTKDEVEDYTGKIPLFLDNCVVKDEKNQPLRIDLGTKFFLKIYNQALRFEQEIHSKYKDNLIDLEMYDTFTLLHRRR